MRRLLAVAAFAAAAVVSLAGCGREEHHPVVFKDPLVDVTLYEGHSEVLVDWMKRGYKDMALVSVDYLGNVWMIPDRKIEALKGLMKAGKWAEVASRGGEADARSLYTDLDFLYAAYRLGVIKKLYWVTPSRLLEHPDLETAARDFLKAFGYPDKVVKTFRKKGQAVKGKIYGLEVWICSPAGLPKIDGPVLFTLDADYFSSRLKRENPSELNLMRDLSLNLRSAGIEVKHASVAYSSRGGLADIVARHMGEEAAAAIRRPEVIAREDYPALWVARSNGFRRLREGKADQALEEFDRALAGLGEEPSLLAGRAVSLALLGRDTEAFGVLERLSALRPEYGRTYIHIGRALAEQGQTERAEKYYKAYLATFPSLPDGLLAYGDLLYNSKRDEEALKAYMGVLAESEDVRAVMYAGDALVHLGRFEEARAMYERGTRLLAEVGYRSMRDFPESERNIDLLRKGMQPGGRPF